MAMLFVTATGTDIGKTFVTLALLHAARAQGRKARALKPVASGFDPSDVAASDTGRLLRAQHRGVGTAELDAVSPWRFRAPLSPDMAATRERRRIDFGELVKFCTAAPADARADAPADASADAPADAGEELTLIEGIGGVMVPLDERHTVLDWIGALDCAVVLVAGSYLGTLSHTLTAAHALATRGRALAGIVVSESAEQPVPAEETATVLRRFVGPTRVSVLRRTTPERAAEDEGLQAMIARAL
jgi:dethiobiotin synthetase